jgi:hypothetical protein
MKAVMRKSILFRVPEELAHKYKEQATSEGHINLSAWIITVLNERLVIANNLKSQGQQESKNQRRA